MAHRVCPWWMGYVLVNPLRRLVQDPEKILSPYIRPQMTVADVGAGMGYFSLDMAKLVGPEGTVVCVDLQKKMTEALNKRAMKKGLNGNIKTIVCTEERLGLDEYEGTLDFILAFYLVHEIPDKEGFIHQIYDALKPSGKLLVAEPKGHIAADEFRRMVMKTEKSGFVQSDAPEIFRSFAALLEKR